MKFPKSTPGRMIQHAVAASVVGRMGPSLVASVSVHLFSHAYTVRRYRAENAFARCGVSPSSWARQSAVNVVLFVGHAVVYWLAKDM